MSIYLSKYCKSLEEFKKHRFDYLLNEKEKKNNLECYEIENKYYLNYNLVDIKGNIHKFHSSYILINVDDGTQIQISYHQGEADTIEIFNKNHKLIYNVNLDSPSIYFRPSGLGKGKYYMLNDDFTINNLHYSDGMDILDFDENFLKFIDTVGEATYKPFLRGEK